MSTHILGISAFYHDAAACLVRDGEIVAAAQEERFSRVKHDPSFPAHAIRYCLEEGGIDAARLDAVAFYEKPWLKFERLLETYLGTAPRGLRPYLMAMPLWLKEKLWIEGRIRDFLGYEEGPFFFPEHHQSHAASAFFPSPFEEAAIVTFDAVGEWTTTSWGIGRGERIELRQEVPFPHSVGLLYSAFTYYLGFRVNSGEYKVMGLAPYGEPRYVDTILDELIDLREDGSFHLNQRYFHYLSGLTMTGSAFHELFGGPPRARDEPLTRRHMDLARSVQVVTEEAMMRIARYVRGESGMRHLCLAGGVSLNCVANGKILRAGLFDDLWIQPAAGDAGGALGAALFTWHQVRGEPRSVEGGHDRQRGSYLGPAFDAGEVAAWLEREDIPHERLGEDDLLERTCDLLEDEKVVGWLHGRMEFGPRALGHRSILGDARSPTMQSVLNLKIKGRESFRPFAPSCLAEDASRYFDLDRDSPYMLLVAPVREERRRRPDPAEEPVRGVEAVKVVRSDVPAVTHVDYTARVQTVRGETSPRYARLLGRFRDRTGYGLVVNTSFNLAGEPIVCTPAEAYRDFMVTEMDALVLEDCLLLKAAQPGSEGDAERRRAAAVRPHPWTWPEPQLDRSPTSHLRKFGLVMTVGFGLLGLLFWWRGVPAAPWMGGIGAAFLVVALVAPRVLGPVERGWMWLAEKMGAVMTRLLLTITFFVGVTPLALLGRLVGRDRLAIRSFGRTDAPTFWQDVDPDGPVSRPEEPY